MARTAIHGHVTPGFEPVAETFRSNFRRRGELGASFCAYHRGERVVDLWGGLADKESRRPWAADSLGVIFSATKGLVATCFLMLAERGQLDYDAPVVEYWPGFGQGGKAAITVRDIFNHRSGVAALDRPLGIDHFERWDPVVSAMEEQAPLWEPGSAQGYHGITFGPLAAELFRRVAGVTLGAFLRDEVAGVLEADVYLGLPPDHDERVVTLYPVTSRRRLLEALPYVLTHNTVERRLARAFSQRGSHTQRAFAVPAALGVGGVHRFGSPRVRRLELPWANGHASARGLARVYSALVGGTLCRPESVAAVHTRQSFQSPDNVLLKPLGWSQGFIKEETGIFSPRVEAFGHPGLGGALGFCDPVGELAWAYVCNRLDFRLRSPRAMALSAALYRSSPVAA